MNIQKKFTYCYNHEFQTLTQIDETGKVRSSMQMPKEDLSKLSFLDFCESQEDYIDKQQML